MTTTLATVTPDPIDVALAKFHEGELSRDDMALLLGRINEMLRMAKAAKEAFEETLVEWINKNGEFSIAVGERGEQCRYWVGHDKAVKCRDVRALWEFLLGCDMRAAMNCLAANAFKHGTVRKLLIDMNRAGDFDLYFETKVKDTLEGGEPAPRRLQSSDSRFVK